MNKPSKYGLKSGTAEYNRVKARRYAQMRTYKDQLNKWEDIVKTINLMSNLHGMSVEKIAEEMTRTTKYKIIKRSKEMNYGN